MSLNQGMNGAAVTDLTNYIDDGAFNKMLDSKSDAAYYDTLVDALGELEDIADDLGDNGLNALLNDFFKAVSNLEQHPSDMSVRQQYVIAAQNVCDKFNSISKKYDNLQEDKFQDVSMQTSAINSLLSDLAEANKAHALNQSTATQSQINGILEQLSNYMDVTTEKNGNGTVNLYIGNTAVVMGSEQKYTLQSSFDANAAGDNLKFSLKSTENEDFVIENGVNDAFKSGAFKAYVEFLNGEGKTFANVNDMKAALNSAASAFANAINEIQNYDNGDSFAASITTDTDGSLILEKATEPMFSSTNGGVIDASNITVNPNIAENPFLVAAARIDLNNYKDEDGNVNPKWVQSIGNSDNATELTAVQNKKICSYGDGTNNCTLSQFLTNNAAKNGMDLANIAKKADTYNDIADADALNYANIIGVNLDEELADMIRYQRAFEASARMFSTVNDLMGTIIGMV